MQKLILLLLIFTVLSSTAAAQEEEDWTATDTILLAASTTLIAMDWAQTLHMARNPDKYEEYNPLVAGIIGDHPSEGRVNSFVGAAMIGNALIARVLPGTYRKYWLSFWIVAEAATVRNNHYTGAKISLHF